MSGLVRHKQMSSVRVTVMSVDGKRLKGAKVRLIGVGIRAVTRKTDAHGSVSFKVKPKRKGKLLVTATKPDIQAAYGALTVR